MSVLKHGLIIVAIALDLALAGCTAGGGRPHDGLAAIQPGALPAPTTTDLIVPARPFVIGPLDQVSIEVGGLPELSRSIQVDPSGQVSLPMVGVVKASGLTPAQLADAYATGLRGYHVRAPEVTVNLTDTVSQTVSVGGAVTTPGIYPVTGRMTLMRAIARAQGVNEFAKQREVVVYRRVDGHDLAALYDVRAIQAGLYPDPEIYANDVIEVGESRGRHIFKDFISVTPLLSAAIIAALN